MYRTARMEEQREIRRYLDRKKLEAEQQEVMRLAAMEQAMLAQLQEDRAPLEQELASLEKEFFTGERRNGNRTDYFPVQKTFTPRPPPKQRHNDQPSPRTPEYIHLEQFDAGPSKNTQGSAVDADASPPHTVGVAPFPARAAFMHEDGADEVSTKVKPGFARDYGL